MEQWDEKSNKVSKLRPDIEKAKGLLKVTELREVRAKNTSLPLFATLLTEEYYEIIKELITGIMSIDGWKTTSHELLIGYLAKYYPQFENAQIALIDQLRIIRNDIGYRGIMINPEYIERNQQSILQIISKLKHIIYEKIGKDKK